MNRKRVLIITDYFIPHWTGIVTSLVYLIEQYKNVYDFSVLTINHTNALPSHEDVFGVKIIRVPYQLSFSRVPYSFLYLLHFIRILHEFDTIFINSPNSNILFVTAIARLFRKRVVIFHQGDLILTKGFKNQIIEKIFDFQTNVSCSLAYAVGTYTNDYAQHSRILSKHLKKLYTFLIIPKIKNSTEKLSLIKTGKKDGVNVFGFAGRYVEEKGVDILLSAIQEVIKKTTKVHFFFAGDEMSYEKNNYFKKFHQLSHYVTNLGLLNTAEMNSFFSSIDYLIVPSRSDCLSLVQIETLLHGVPIIASNAPGVRVPVMKTYYGFLFEKENVSDLAKKILFSIEKRATLEQYKKNINPLLNQATYDTAIRTFIGK